MIQLLVIIDYYQLLRLQNEKISDLKPTLTYQPLWSLSHGRKMYSITPLNGTVIFDKFV